jgi:hypothetical protein
MLLDVLCPLLGSQLTCYQPISDCMPWRSLHLVNFVDYLDGCLEHHQMVNSILHFQVNSVMCFVLCTSCIGAFVVLDQWIDNIATLQSIIHHFLGHLMWKLMVLWNSNKILGSENLVVLCHVSQLWNNLHGWNLSALHVLCNCLWISKHAHELQQKKKSYQTFIENKSENVTYLFIFYLFYKLKIYNLFYNDNDIYNTSSHWQ